VIAFNNNASEHRKKTETVTNDPSTHAVGLAVHSSHRLTTSTCPAHIIYNETADTEVKIEAYTGINGDVTNRRQKIRTN